MSIFVKRIIAVITCIIILTLTGCAKNKPFTAVFEDYAITEEDNKWYISIDDTVSFDINASDVAVLQFDSLEEMRDKIMNNKLTVSELATMDRNFPKSPDGRICICNMNDLCSPIMPKQMRISNVGLSGINYAFQIVSDDSVFGVFSVYDEETYSRFLDQNYTNFFDNDLITVIETWHNSDRDSTTVRFTTRMGTSHRTCYTVTIENKVLTIAETYFIQMNNSMPESDTIPISVEVFVDDNGRKCHLYLGGFTERPSVEWLSSFGLIEFVQSNDTVTQ